MFEQLSQDDKRTVFKALKTLIESPLGAHEFYNGDRMHPYQSRDGGEYAETDVRATPENTPLYRMLSELSQALKDAGDIDYAWWYDFCDWQDFCVFCRDCHTREVAATGVEVSDSASSGSESSDDDAGNYESSRSALPDGVEG